MTQVNHRPFAAVLLAIVCGICSGVEAADTPTRILIVVGPSSHPPGTHEVAASGRLIEYCLEHAENVPGMQGEVTLSWPKDRQSLDSVAAVVFSGDRFPPEEMPDRDRIMAASVLIYDPFLESYIVNDDL